MQLILTQKHQKPVEAKMKMHQVKRVLEKKLVFQSLNKVLHIRHVAVNSDHPQEHPVSGIKKFKKCSV